VIVLDTSVLSLAFRRRKPDADAPGLVALLGTMIAEDRPMRVPGIVLQELLSGTRTSEQFNRLRAAVAAFPVVFAGEADHVRAAAVSNACRREGIACSTVDALIAAMTVNIGGQLFTTDADFEQIATVCDLSLFPHA
jgi:predicted nucleic acid-binding protein